MTVLINTLREYPDGDLVLGTYGDTITLPGLPIPFCGRSVMETLDRMEPELGWYPGVSVYAGEILSEHLENIMALAVMAIDHGYVFVRPSIRFFSFWKHLPLVAFRYTNIPFTGKCEILIGGNAVGALVGKGGKNIAIIEKLLGKSVFAGGPTWEKPEAFRRPVFTI